MVRLSQTNKNAALRQVFTQDIELNDESHIAFLDPGLSSSKSAKRQANEGGTYDSLFEAFERTWGAKHGFEAMVDPKSEVIVEMGCANMLIYNAFKALRLYPNYIGIDIRRDYLEDSQNNRRKDVVALCADLTKGLPIVDNSVSAVILSEVVEHLTYEQNMVFLREAHRILRPGGKLLISSPVNTRDREFHNVEDETHLGHVFFWNSEDLVSEMEGLGFTTAETSWGYSISAKIRIDELKKKMHPEVAKFIGEIGRMYGSPVARALALSDPNIVNGGCRFVFVK